MKDEKTDKYKKNRKKNVAGWVIAVLVLICISIAILEIKNDFTKFNKAAGYVERIINIVNK